MEIEACGIGKLVGGDFVTIGKLSALLLRFEVGVLCEFRVEF